MVVYENYDWKANYNYLYAIILIFFTMNAYLQYHNKITTEQYKALSGAAAELTNTAKDIQIELWRKNTYVRNYILTGDSKYVQAYEKSQKSIDDKIVILEEKMTDQEAGQEIAVLKLAMSEYNNVLLQGIAVRDKLGTEEILKFLAASGERVGYIEKIVDDFTAYIAGNVKLQSEAAEAAEVRIAILTVIVSIIMVFAAVVSAVWLSRRISKPLGLMAQTADAIAHGNLQLQKLQYSRNDEIGDTVKAFQSMVGGLRSLIEGVSSTVNHVFTSSEQLNAVAKQSSQASEQVAEATVEVAGSANLQTKEIDLVLSAVQDMVAGSTRIGQSAVQVAEKSNETAKSALQGSKAVTRAEEQMQLINDSVNHSVQVVQDLNASSRQIGEIVSVITSIAGQTNLLALNAAIEAARAGEQGKGFAVVADEVRKLAEQSQEAAQRITNIITEIQAKTDAAVTLMNQGHDDVIEGSQVMLDTGKQFEQIVNLVKELADEIKIINVDIEKNSAFSIKVLKSVDKVREMAVHTASSADTISAASEQQLASMQEVSASSRLLADKAETLKQLTSQFTL